MDIKDIANLWPYVLLIVVVLGPPIGYVFLCPAVALYKKMSGGASSEASMTHKQKMARLREDLKAHGIDPKRASPPWYRLLRDMGLMVRPPHFQSVAVNRSILTIFQLWLFLVFVIALTPACMGCGQLFLPLYSIFFLFGLGRLLKQTLMEPRKYAEEASKLNLPAWENYPTKPPAEEHGAPEPLRHATEPDTRYRSMA
jgi:hypothetical protein